MTKKEIIKPTGQCMHLGKFGKWKDIERSFNNEWYQIRHCIVCNFAQARKVSVANDDN